MAFLRCLVCGGRLSKDLHPVAAEALDRDARDGRPTVDETFVAADDEPVVAWRGEPGEKQRVEKMPAGCWVVHPHSVLGLVGSGSDYGCCGSDGLDGLNRSCEACLTAVATASTDCWTPHKVRFLPDTVGLTEAGD